MDKEKDELIVLEDTISVPQQRQLLKTTQELARTLTKEELFIISGFTIK